MQSSIRTTARTLGASAARGVRASAAADSVDQGTVEASALDPGKVNVGNFQMPTSIGPNESVPWSFTVDNDTDINFTLPDHCISRRLLNASGTNVQVTVSINGRIVHQESACIPDEGGSMDFSGEFFAPSSPQIAEVVVEVEGLNSGADLDRFTQDLSVNPEGPTPGDCPDGFRLNPETGTCEPINGGDPDDDGSGGLSNTTVLLLGMLGASALFVVIALLSPV